MRKRKVCQWIALALTVTMSIDVIPAIVAATAATGGAAIAFAGVVIAGVKSAAISGTIGMAVGAGTEVVSHRITTGSWNGAGKAAARACFT